MTPKVDQSLHRAGKLPRDTTLSPRRRACPRPSTLGKKASRDLSIVAFVFLQVRRVGEADNPGPFQYGGGTSSGSGSGFSAGAAEQCRWPGQAFRGGSLSDPNGEAWEEEPTPPHLVVPGEEGNRSIMPLYAEAAAEPTVPVCQNGYMAGITSNFDMSSRIDSCAYECSPVSDDGKIFSDFDWNTKLDELGLTRFGMSPAEIAYRWQEKQQAERLASEWADFEQQWRSLEASPALLKPVCPETELLAQTTTWIPVAETNHKKAANWRSRERRRREAVPNTPIDDPPSTQTAPVLLEVQHDSSAQGEGEGEVGGTAAARVRPARASRKNKVLDIYTMNTSGKPAALAALGALGPFRKSVAVVALQEHHCLAEAVPDLQHQAAQLGWNLAAVAATVKHEGPSGGVALAVPKHVPVASTRLVQLDLSPSESPGRLGSLWVQAGIPGGMLVLSAYLWHSEGLTARNLRIILTALAAAKAHGGPWVLAGDFNNPPSVIEHGMSAALKAAGAAVIATKVPTHYPGGEAAPAVLDYAIVDDRIANGRVLKYIKISDIPIGKHRAVQIGVSNKGHVAYVSMALKPRAFPAAVPIGCARRPVDAPGAIEEVGAHKFYADTLACAEAEIGRRHDLVDSAGRVRKEFIGRSKGFRTKLRLLLPPRTSSFLGEAGKEAYLLRWVHERLAELQFCAKARAAGSLTVNSLRQMMGILDRLRRLSRDIERMATLENVDARWKQWLSDVLVWGSEGGEEILSLPMQAALDQSNEAAAKHLAAAKTRWNSWVKDKLKGGASAVHSFVKRSIEPPPCAGCSTGTNGRISASNPQER